MLTEKERSEILNEIAGCPSPQAASVAALKIVQQHRGWVDGEIEAVARLLGMTPAELEGVATFFSHIYLKPRGRHTIFVCDSISCWVMGYDPVRRHLEECLGIKLGQTTADGNFTLLPIACLGLCDQGPAMMVDTKLYTELDSGKIDEIIETYR